jgi:hypothetical protein
MVVDIFMSTDEQTDGQGESNIPPNFIAEAIKWILSCEAYILNIAKAINGFGLNIFYCKYIYNRIEHKFFKET